jgi:hypothetical protein
MSDEGTPSRLTYRVRWDDMAGYKAGRITRPLTEVELAAMGAWRKVYGRRWRAALGTAWKRHEYMGVADRHIQPLAYLRNSRGPSWLVRFKFPAGSIR